MENERVSVLNELLASMRDEGTEVDSGQFSVSADKALHKIEQYSLKDPMLFVLEAVALAVCLGATEFRVTSGLQRVSVEFDGEILNDTHFRDPVRVLFEPDADDTALHLALIITGLKKFAGKSSARIESGLVSYQLFEEEWRMSPGIDGCERNRIVVERPFLSLTESKPSLKTVLDVAKLAPLRLFLNGKSIFGLFHAPAYGNEFVGQLQLEGQPGLWRMADKGLLTETRPIDDTFSACLFFGPPLKAAEQGLVVLRNGLCYRLPATELGPGVSGLVISNHLRRDLGGASVAQNSEYRRIIDTLRSQIKEYVLTLIQGERRWKKANRAIVPLLESFNEPKVKEWVREFESLIYEKSAQQDLDLVAQALQSGDLEKAESAALAELEKFLVNTEKLQYRPLDFIKLAAEQDWLLPTEYRAVRLRSAREMILLAQELEGSRASQDGFSEQLHQILCLRRQSKFGQALELCRESDDKNAVRMEVELLLSLVRYDEAQRKLLDELGAKDVESYEYQYGDPIFAVEYLAQICQLTGEHDQYDRLLGALQGDSYCNATNSIRADAWARHSRGRSTFANWLKRRVRSSGMSAWAFFGERRHLPRALSRALRGESLSRDLNGPFRKFYKDTGKIYLAFFEVVRLSVAHQLRLNKEFKKADHLLATTHMLLRVTSRRDVLATGDSYQRIFADNML